MAEKSARERPIESPIAFRPCSNGEFVPRPETERDRRAERRFLEIVDEKARRLGMSRRRFAQGAGGAVAALVVLNEVYGCGGDDSPGGGMRDAGADAGTVGVDVPGYDAPADAMEDAGLACEVLAGDEFIFDVQVHTPSPLSPWREGEPIPMDAETFLRTVFIESETAVACLSGVPGARGGGIGNAEARRMLQEIVDRVAGPRLRYHVNVDPTRGPSELDYMQEAAEMFDVAAWKVYPHVGPWRLDDAENGMPFVAQASALGVRIIAAHRGIAGDSGDYIAPSSPHDVVVAARATPDVQFLTYHSGWQSNVDEDHPFDASDPNPRGVDRLIKAVLDEGIGPDGNVYAELGSTWRNLMTSPSEAAHVLGKLMLHLGEDRIVWGTDSVFTGTPQEQIVALRAFEIPESYQSMYGYPALTDAARRKIFGLNAARVYGVDVDATRCVLDEDDLTELRMAYLHDPASVDVPSQKRYGPRNRRELLAFLRWEAYLERGV
jgi:hypothetical protein